MAEMVCRTRYFEKNHDSQESTDNNNDKRSDKIMRIGVFLKMKQNFQRVNYYYCLQSVILMNSLTSISTLNFHPGLLHTVNEGFFPPKLLSQFTENQMEHIKNLLKCFSNRYYKTNLNMNRLLSDLVWSLPQLVNVHIGFFDECIYWVFC